VAIFVLSGILESRTCPLPMTTAADLQWLELHREWEAGRLPFAGGRLEQPAYYSEMMETIAAEIIRHNEAQ